MGPWPEGALGLSEGDGPTDVPGGATPRSFRRLVGALKLLGVFTAVAVLAATQFYFSFGGRKPTPWVHFFWVSMPTWFTWALFTPLIFKAARRWPFERSIWPRSALRHAGVVLLIAPLRSALDIYLSLLVGVIFEGRPASFLAFFPWADFLGFMVETPVTYAAIVGVASALEYHRKLREREVASSRFEAAVTEAQLKTLRSQLNPHFLFNTLNAIGALSRKDPEATNRMIALLCGLLRRSLDTDGRQLIPLKEELDFARDYLDIEKVRFPDRLRVLVDVPAGLLDLPVPSMVLQPLVENAVRHGIAPRSTAGLISIRAALAGNALEMVVEDNGVGLAGGGSADEGRGLGLTRERLRLQYGDRAGLELSQRAEGGVRVTLVVPLPPGLAVPGEEASS